MSQDPAGGIAIETHILTSAAEMVAQARHRAAALRDELDQIEERKAAIEAELGAATLKAQRLGSFQVRQGGDYICPRCWIEEESAAPLALKKGGGWRGEFFFCELCALEIKLGGE